MSTRHYVYSQNIVFFFQCDEFLPKKLRNSLTEVTLILKSWGHAQNGRLPTSRSTLFQGAVCNRLVMGLGK